MKIFGGELVVNSGNFQFSGARPEKLGSTEYTLATIVCDKTGSVSSFAGDLLKMKQAVVSACQKSPRKDFLMLRNVDFNSKSDEMHGFAELRTIDASQYQAPNCGGMTALYDATFLAIAATNEYARILSEQDFGVNAVVFVITDGDDNQSTYSPKNVLEELQRGVQSEYLESINVVLIGVNAAQCRTELEAFKNNAGLTQFVDVADVTPENLARLADFVSRSISSQSQSLGTGGASQALTF